MSPSSVAPPEVQIRQLDYPVGYDYTIQLLIPVNVVTDSDLIPGSDSDAIPVTIGAKRRWRDHSGRSDRDASTGR